MHITYNQCTGEVEVTSNANPEGYNQYKRGPGGGLRHEYPAAKRRRLKKESRATSAFQERMRGYAERKRLEERRMREGRQGGFRIA